MLVEADLLFGRPSPRRKKSSNFRIFSNDNSNSIFDEHATSLLPIWPDKRTKNLEVALGEDFVAVYDKILDCNRADYTAKPKILLLTPILCLVFVLTAILKE